MGKNSGRDKLTIIDSVSSKNNDIQDNVTFTVFWLAGSDHQLIYSKTEV